MTDVIGVIGESDEIGIPVAIKVDVVIGVIDVVGVIGVNGVIGVIEEIGALSANEEIGAFGAIKAVIGVLVVIWWLGTVLLTVTAKLTGRRALRLSSLSLAK